MVFNDTTNLNGAIQDCESWLFGNNYGSISGNNDMLKTFTKLLNQGLDETHAVLFQTDGVWQYDDRNYTDITVAKTNLADSQSLYTLDSSHLIIEGVEVMDSAGNFYPIKQKDYRKIRETGQSESEFYETDGKPIFYDIQGSTLKLYPAPKTSDVTLTQGLKVIFKREADYFTYTDTTKEFGIPRTFHDLPVLFGCGRFAKQNQMTEKSRELDALIQKRSQEFKNFINRRNADRKLRVRPAYRSAR